MQGERQSERNVNGVRLHVVEAGPPDGTPVVLLHGFPEFRQGWRRRIGPLAEAGFRVLAPDQRGYGTSEKPGRVPVRALDVGHVPITGNVQGAWVNLTSRFHRNQFH